MPQPVRGREPLHEVHLVDAHAQKKSREFRQRLFAEMTPSVQIVAAGQVAGGKPLPVFADAARKAAGNRPQAARVQRTAQNGMRHQPRHAPVAVEEGVNPQQAVMGSGRGENRVRLAETAIGGRETLQETGHGARAHGAMPADPDMAFAQRAGHDPDALLRVRLFDPEQVVGQVLAKPAVDFHEALGREGAVLQPAAVDPFLDVDMGPGLELQGPLFGFGAVVFPERAFDIDRMGVVALNQVAVVAIHGADERGKPRPNAVRQAVAETGGLHRQLDRKVGQSGPVPGRFADRQRLHAGDGFAAVVQRLERRIHVRFHVRIFRHEITYILLCY